MAARAEIAIGNATLAAAHTEGGTVYLIETPTGVLYHVFADSANDIRFRKSTDGGFTWSNSTTVFTGTVTSFSVWYDRWSGIAAGLIHIAYVESVTDDCLYRTINTESSDALSTQTSIFAGASTASPSALSICRSRGGNVYCGVYIDIGAEGGFFRLPNANVPNGAWDAARAAIGEADTTTPGDHWVLMPGFAADNQDMMAFYWDRSASEISRKLYDDSANSWGETSIATSMSLGSPATSWCNMAATPDLTNSQNILIAWSAIDTLNADLRCWAITESAITAKTDVVTNSTDDQGRAALSIDPDGVLRAYYHGASGGGETFTTAIKTYTKVSSDGGTTWGPETALSPSAIDQRNLWTCPRPYIKRSAYSGIRTGQSDLFIGIELDVPSAQHQLYGG